MSFFKKKEKPQPNWIDNKADEYRDSLWDIRDAMKKNIKNILSSQELISCLPDGADKEAEEKDLAHYKYSLLCNIGAYDGVLADWRIMLAEASDEDKANMINANTVPRTTSHDYAKLVIRQYHDSIL